MFHRFKRAGSEVHHHLAIKNPSADKKSSLLQNSFCKLVNPSNQINIKIIEDSFSFPQITLIRPETQKIQFYRQFYVRNISYSHFSRSP